MLKIIDIFILKIFLRFFLIILIAVCSTIIIFDVIDSAVSNPDLKEVLLDALKLLPTTLELILPYTTMLSTVLTFGSLAKNSEILSMKSAGLSQIRIIRSVLYASIVIAIGLYYNQSYLVRGLNAEQKSFSISSPSTEYNWFQSGNRIIHLVNPLLIFNTIDSLDLFTFDLNEKTIEFQRQTELTKVENQWQGKSEISDYYSSNSAGKNSKTTSVADLALDVFLENSTFLSLYLPLEKLYQAWGASPRGLFEARLALLLFAQKISYILFFFLLMLLAVAFSSSEPRSHKNIAKIILVTIIFYICWFTDQFMFLLAKEGAVNIWVGAFSVNVLMLLFLLIKIKFTRS